MLMVQSASNRRSWWRRTYSRYDERRYFARWEGNLNRTISWNLRPGISSWRGLTDQFSKVPIGGGRGDVPLVHRLHLAVMPDPMPGHSPCLVRFCASGTAQLCLNRPCLPTIRF